jgi:uncharacterized membrane protein
MLAFLYWYLLVSLTGWLVFPLAYRLLPGLSSRGFALARSLGLLIWGYIFWLLASLGVVRNDPGGLLLALAILAAVSVLAGRRSFVQMAGWLRQEWRLVVSVEALFLLAFAAMAFVRAANPEILGTEKPMELAFINAILRSPTFPPHDPWLSGYAISYYYFGYVLVAMLARLAGTSGGVAFNLGVSLVFALSAVGAYGVVHDLLSVYALQAKVKAVLSSAYKLWLALLGPVFVLLVSNVEGFLQVLHTRGLFWSVGPTGELTSSFWKWLDIVDLNQPPALPFSWIPTRFWWWWRASRVVQDYNFSGAPLEIIDEFPVFSYLLADSHPHVLAMPFAFLGMGLALNLFLSLDASPIRWLRVQLGYRLQAWTGVLLFALGVAGAWFGLSTLSLRLTVLALAGMVVGGLLFVRIPVPEGQGRLRLFTRDVSGESQVGINLYLDTPIFLLYALVLGGLAFLNTWDFPFYLVLFAGVYATRRWLLPGEAAQASLGRLLVDFVSAAVSLGAVSVLFYLPFYLGFSSQAGGIIPNLIFPTRGAQLWVMFGTLLLPLLAYLFYLWRAHGSLAQMRKGFAIAGGFVLLLWVSSWLFALVIVLLPGVNTLFLNSLGAMGGSELFAESLLRRVTAPGGWLTALLLCGVTVGLLLSARVAKATYEERLSALSPAHVYTLLLVLLGTLLVLGPEFFFLRDQFGWRINTIFKFYYQAWLLWAVAAAFGSAALLLSLSRRWGILFRIGLALVLMVGFTYTSLGLWSKTNGFKPAQGFTLDGTAYLESQSPDDAAAVRWLWTAAPGVVAEAVGGSYSEYARIATLSGLPNVLGWPGHESQWRGGGREMGSRQADLERLYCTRSWDEAQQILSKYNIRYVYIGNLERSSFVPNQDTCPGGLNEDKFRQYLRQAYQNGSVTIYDAGSLSVP